jgi:hypothetical protein
VHFEGVQVDKADLRRRRRLYAVSVPGCALVMGAVTAAYGFGFPVTVGVVFVAVEIGGLTMLTCRIRGGDMVNWFLVMCIIMGTVGYLAMAFTIPWPVTLWFWARGLWGAIALGVGSFTGWRLALGRHT